MPTRKTGRKRIPDDAFAALNAGDARYWNRWRKRNPDSPIVLRSLKRTAAPLVGFDLHDADMRKMDLPRAELAAANLRGVRLNGASLIEASLRNADCRDAHFGNVDLGHANLCGAKMQGARFGHMASLKNATLEQANLTAASMRDVGLERADLSETVLDRADLRGANLSRAVLYNTKLRGTDLRGASVYEAFLRGIVVDEETKQKGLMANVRIWFTNERRVDAHVSKVDDLRVAYFLTVLQERGVVSSIVNAGANSRVLILGRFTRARKAVLNALAHKLETRGKIPIIFDFPGPEDRELSDTVRLLATLSEFIVVDLSDPRSVPLELQATIPGLMVPVVPIIDAKRRVFAMFQDIQRRYFWVLPPVSYVDKNELVRHVDKGILHRVNLLQRRIDRRREQLASNAISIAEFGPGDESGDAVEFIR